MFTRDSTETMYKAMVTSTMEDLMKTDGQREMEDATVQAFVNKVRDNGDASLDRARARFDTAQAAVKAFIAEAKITFDADGVAQMEPQHRDHYRRLEAQAEGFHRQFMKRIDT